MRTGDFCLSIVLLVALLSGTVGEAQGQDTSGAERDDSLALGSDGQKQPKSNYQSVTNFDLILNLSYAASSGGEGPDGSPSILARLRPLDGTTGYLATSIRYEPEKRWGRCHNVIQGQLAAREETSITDVDPVAIERATYELICDHNRFILGQRLAETGFYGTFALKGPGFFFSRTPEDRYDESFNPRTFRGFSYERYLASRELTLLIDLGEFLLDEVDLRTLEAKEISGRGLGAKLSLNRRIEYFLEGRWYELEDGTAASGPTGPSEALEAGIGVAGSFGYFSFKAEAGRKRDLQRNPLFLGELVILTAWTELTWDLTPRYGIGIQAQWRQFDRNSDNLVGSPVNTSRSFTLGFRWSPGGDPDRAVKLEAFYRNLDATLPPRPASAGGQTFLPIVDAEPQWGGQVSLAWRFDFLKR